MKFTFAWAEIATQNSILKLLVLILSGLSIVLAITSSVLALREPLVIDRECYSTVAKIGDNQRNSSEVEAFVKESLRQRLDTGATALSEYVSEEERNYRDQEQKDFLNKRISQRIVVNSIKVDGNSVSADVDRILSVGTIKSVLPMPVVITISTTDRTQVNPYGLKMIRVALVKKDGER